MIIVVIDANVLFSRLKRNILLCLAEPGYFMPHWNRTILEETRKNLVKRIKISNAKSVQIIERMNLSFPNALVKNYRVLNKNVSKINQKDKHVAKTAIFVSASEIITEDRNLQHQLKSQGLKFSTPDIFVAGIIRSNGKHTIPAIREAKNLFDSSLSGNQFINILNSNEFKMIKTANILLKYNNLI